MPGAERSIVINTSPEVLYDVIADYARYPEFLKDISKVTVEEQTDDASVVTFELNLIKTVRYTIRLSGDRPRTVSWTFVRSNILKSNTGGWVLEDLGNNQTRATYRLDVSVGMFVPKRIVSTLTGTTLPTTLDAFKRRAESRT
ncbi:MAG: SRPBCC family protein [Myxococcota bacterium]